MTLEPTFFFFFFLRQIVQGVVLADWKGERSRKSELGWRPRDGQYTQEKERRKKGWSGFSPCS